MDPATAKLIVDVISTILPFGEISSAFGKYFEYKAKRVEIEGRIRELEIRAPVVKAQIGAQLQLELERLRTEDRAFSRRMNLLERELSGASLEREQITTTIRILNDRLRGARGDELMYVTSAISALTVHLSSQSTALLNLLGQEVTAGQRSMELGGTRLPPLLEEGR